MAKKDKQNATTKKRMIVIILLLLFLVCLSIFGCIKMYNKHIKNTFIEQIHNAVEEYKKYSKTAADKILRIDVTDERIKLDNSSLINGTIISVNENEIEVYYISDGKFCASGNINDLKITKGNCKTTQQEETVMKTYLINIDPNNGLYQNETEEQKVKVINKEEIIILNPKKNNSNFSGWNIELSGDIYNNDGFLTTHMTASWDEETSNDIESKNDNIDNIYKENNIQKLIVEIDPQQGVINGKKDIIKTTISNDNKIYLENPIKEGYIFTGWKSISKLDEKGVLTTKFEALYEKDLHKLTINLDGGKSTQKLEYSKIKGEKIKLEVPTKDGYIFYKWITNDNTSKVTDSEFIMGNSDVIIKAIWSKSKNNLTVNLDGGTLTEYFPQQMSPKEKLYLETPMKTGYEFIGWTILGENATTRDNYFIMGSNDATLTANWKLEKYRINYELNGGKAINAKEYTINTKTFMLNNPSREHYDFIGWTGTNLNKTTLKVEIEQGSNGDKTFVANWLPIKYKIEYILNGGNNKVYSPSTYTYESEIVLNNPIKTGYDFEGWYDNPNFEGTKISKISKNSFGNKKLYAKWEITKYAISYDVNGGNELVEPITEYTINDFVDLPLPTKEGYKFKGWYTNPDLTSSIYGYMEKGTTGNKKFYAKWVPYKSYENVNIYEILLNDDAEFDNTQSAFVAQKDGIDFSKTSTLSNGHGAYILRESLNDENPIYYYRGNVENNNVIFGGFCWKIVRTTSKKGIKLIYNGAVSTEGTCNNSGANAQIGRKAFNSVGYTSGGYMYDTRETVTSNYFSSIEDGTVFAKSYDYLNGTYTLKDLYIKDSTKEENVSEIFKEYRYTCLTNTTECTQAKYVYFARPEGTQSNIYFMTMKDGRNITQMVNDKISNSSNKTNSTIKGYIDPWYKNNLLQYEETYIEDEIYCNERELQSTSPLVGGTDIFNISYYKSHERTMQTFKPSLYCSKQNSFTKNAENGNGKLTYQIGLISIDEAVLAGNIWQSESNSYLKNGTLWWTMSPAMTTAASNYIFVIYNGVDSVNVNFSMSSIGATGVRPVITLKYGTKVSQGNGTVNNPFVIK